MSVFDYSYYINVCYTHITFQYNNNYIYIYIQLYIIFKTLPAFHQATTTY